MHAGRLSYNSFNTAKKTVKAASYGQPGEMHKFSTNTHWPPQSINHEHQAYIPTRSFSSPLEMIGD
jgi:hypothetical protein